MKHTDYLKKKKNREIRRRIISILSALVVFVATYALVLPALTLDVKTASMEPGMSVQQEADPEAVSVPEASAEEEAVEEEPAKEEEPAETEEPEKDEKSADEKAGEQAPAEEASNEKADEAAQKTEAEQIDSADAAASDKASSSNNDAADQSADQSGTDKTEDTAAEAEDAAADAFRIPELEAVNFDTILTDKTDFYYYHEEISEEEGSEDASKKAAVSSTDVQDWKKVKEDTILAPEDFVRVYLAYTIPAGALNETNTVARYRIPEGLELTDKQIKAINENENGISGTDKKADNYDKYLGAEAIEGTRTPDKILKEGTEEYISATVKAEKVYDEDENYLGQDLIFTFVPYTVQKNQIAYDENGKAKSEGKAVKGWFSFDLVASRIDFKETKADEDSEDSDGLVKSQAKITFVKENKKKDIEEISRVLTMAGFSDKEKEQESKTLEYKNTDAGYNVTITYKADAEIPDNAELSVREIEKDTDEYASYLEQAQGAVDQDKSVSDARFFDITILVDGEEFEPKAAVSVQINFTGIEQASTEDTQLLHYTEEEVQVMDKAEFSKSEEADNDTKAVDTVQFETDGFSVFGIVGTKSIEQEITITSPEGEEFTYVVSVTYGTDAEIPEGSRLHVVEYAQDSDEYKAAYEEIINFKTSTIDGFTEEGMSLDALDISILDENDEVVEPKAPVHVNITRKELPDDIETEKLAKTLEVQHIVNTEQGEKHVEIVASPDADKNAVGIIEETVVADFSVDSFSIYTLTWGNVSKTVHYGYLVGETFHEFTNGEEGTVTMRPPTQLGDQLNLEKTISGYRYVTTRINNPTSGRQISPLLLTDPPYKANVRQNYTNANLSDYPSYNTAVAPQTFNARWRYRQLSRLTWNPTGENGYTHNRNWATTGYGVTKPVTFDNSETDIYVVYEKGSNTVVPPGGNEDLGSLSDPSTNKDVQSNNDGTYDVTLSVTGESRSINEKTKANIVIVLDTSWSMYYDTSGNETFPNSLNDTRLAVAKKAINSLADKLFLLNTEESDTIQLAFITFAQRVRNEEEKNTIYSGTDASSFKTMINGLDCASGTNWDDALYAANQIQFGDNDPTYVVFVTDGDPISCAHPYGTYSDWDGGTYYNGRTNYEYALAAKNQADLIIAANKTLYTIGAFGSIANLQAIGGTYLGQANSSETINSYFDDIINEIRQNLGYSDVIINDGITAMTSTSLLNGDPTEFKYYRSGGTEEDGTTEKYDHTANDGRGETWDDAPAAMFLEIIRDKGSSTYRFRKNGSDYTFTDEEKAAFIEKYVSESEQQSTTALHIKTVIWDINLGENQLLENGVTYTIAFTVWPSQKAYDLVADLNNGTKKFDDLPQSDKDQIIEDNGTYYLKTNTKATVDYTSVRMEDGEPVGDPSTGSAPIKDPHGKMILDTERMTVRKDFSHSINSEDPFKKLRFYLVRDGEYYLKNGLTTTVKPEGQGSEAYDYYIIELPKTQLPEEPTQAQLDAYWAEENWSDSIYIAPGLMKGGKLLETGHDYSLYETIVNGKEYEYEFTSQTVRPMNISSTDSTYLILKDLHNVPTSSANTYKINDTDKTYVTPGTGNENVYYVEPNGNKAELVGTNRKTVELDITKIIDDQTGEMTIAEQNAETFTYKVTLTVPVDADTRGITAYEYVARYNDPLGSTRYHIFGYRTSDIEAGTAGINTDFSRFQDKVYGRYTVTTPDHPAGDFTMNSMFEEDAGGRTKTAVIYVTLKQQEVIRFTNLPTGTIYTIEEVYANLLQADPSKNQDATEEANEGRSNNLSDQGYTSVTSIFKNGERTESGSSIIKGEVAKTDLDKRLYNQFTNIRTRLTNDVRAELKVKKVVDGYTWGTEYYNMNLAAGTATYSDEQGGSGTSPMPPNTSVNIYDSTTDHTLSFGEVLYTRPGTYTYILSEYDNSSRMPEVVFAKDVTVSIEVKADEVTGKLYIDNVSDDTGITNNTILTPATQNTLDTVTTTMTNTTRKIHLEKVDSLNHSKKLEKAEFSLFRGRELQYISGDSRILTAEQYEELTAEAQAACKTKLILGETDLKGFAYDTVYELKETKAPDGYIIESASTYFKISSLENTVVMLLTDASGEPLTDEESNPITESDTAIITGESLILQIKNTPGAELPSAGGPGTFLYTLGGICLIMASALMYGFRMRRRERRLK